MVKSAEKLINKKIVVVGGTSGIGFGAAQAFLDAGAKVTVISSNQERVDSAVSRLNSSDASGAVGNVRDESSFVEVLRGLAPIDHIVFSSVDKIIRGKLEDLDLDDAKYLFGVKFWGAVITGKAVKKYDIITPGGSLTLTSGTAALKPGKGASTGAGLNGGVLSLTKGLAGDLADKRIRVNVVVPGLVKTELWGKLGKSDEEQKELYEKTSLPVGFVATPDDIAEAYLYLARADYATGTVVEIVEASSSRLDTYTAMLERKMDLRKCSGFDCKQNAVFGCMFCSSRLYCSLSCFEGDQDWHGDVCKRIYEFVSASPRPPATESTSFKLGLMFPEDSGDVEPYWVECTLCPADEESGESAFETVELPLFDQGMEYHDIARQRQNPGPNIRIWFGLAFLVDGSKLNKSINRLIWKLCRPPGQQRRDWRGPFLAMSLAISNADKDEEIYQDMSASGFRDIAKYLAVHGIPVGMNAVDQFHRTLATFPLLGEVRGVRISCLGDMNFDNKAKYLSVNVSKDHPIMVKGIVAEVSGHMGLPLYVQKLTPKPEWEARLHGLSWDPYQNFEPWFLIMGTNPDEEVEDWGNADLQMWDLCVGPVLVVRQDGKEITPSQVEVLVAWGRHLKSEMEGELEPDGEYWEKYGDVSDREFGVYDMEKARKEFIKTEMCQAKFEEFLEEHKKMKIKEGDASWASVISPFAV
ncbi:uncharacterized protein BP5553_03212 [Venustampulla echinocandica]|uniref:MYND-type zinc finger protein samB n=1 Tax=Venustampulla echinocandica TaxID=2656787 RepID=A0A370TTL1_9HELO|nr:uncharacterized protein BP5553_03212 [Venustampulla echinocandica]RDL38872.1 hypothetical protein BP5553_03212 [Venustampulla echinocandica]